MRKKKIFSAVIITVVFWGCLEVHAARQQQWEMAAVSVKTEKTGTNVLLAGRLEQAAVLTLPKYPVTGSPFICKYPVLERTECAPDYPAMIMVNNALYYDSGEISTELRCGMMDGSITSITEGVPTQSDQSNFGTGYGYQYGVGTIEVYMEDEWHIFIPYDTPSYVQDWDNLSEEERMELDPTYFGQ